MSTDNKMLERAIIAGFFVLLTAVGGYAFNAIDKRMANSEARIIALESTVNTRGERIQALEIEKENIKNDLKEIKTDVKELIRMHMRVVGK